MISPVLFSLFQIGVDGVGRRSCLQLACYMCGIHYHILTAAHHPTALSECLEELRCVVGECGVNARRTLLVLEGRAIGTQHQVSWNICCDVIMSGGFITGTNQLEEGKLRVAMLFRNLSKYYIGMHYIT